MVSPCRTFQEDGELRQDFKLAVDFKRRTLAITAKRGLDDTEDLLLGGAGPPVFTFSRRHLSTFFSLLASRNGGLEGARYPVFVFIDEADLELALDERKFHGLEAATRLVTVRLMGRDARFLASTMLWFLQSLRTVLRRAVLDLFYYLDEALQAMHLYHGPSAAHVPCSLLLALEYLARVRTSAVQDVARAIPATRFVERPEARALFTAASRSRGNDFTMLIQAEWFQTHEENLGTYLLWGSFPDSADFSHENQTEVFAEIRAYLKSLPATRLASVGVPDMATDFLGRLSPFQGKDTTYRMPPGVGDYRCMLLSATALDGFNYLSDTDYFLDTALYQKVAPREPLHQTELLSRLSQSGLGSAEVHSFAATYHPRERPHKRKREQEQGTVIPAPASSLGSSVAGDQ